KDETSTRFSSLPEMETRKVIILDANKDGFKDIFFCNIDSSEKREKPDKLYLNDGKGNFTDVSVSHLPSQNLDTFDAVPIDLNKDGNIDLVLAHMGKAQPSVLMNDGSGKFSLVNVTLPSVPGHYI